MVVPPLVAAVVTYRTLRTRVLTWDRIALAGCGGGLVAGWGSRSSPRCRAVPSVRAGCASSAPLSPTCCPRGHRVRRRRAARRGVLALLRGGDAAGPWRPRRGPAAAYDDPES